MQSIAPAAAAINSGKGSCTRQAYKIMRLASHRLPRLLYLPMMTMMTTMTMKMVFRKESADARG